MSEQPVGYLAAGLFLCPDCNNDFNIPKAPQRVPVYAVNILPYKQSCAKCGDLVVEGQTSAWPELFEKPMPRPRFTAQGKLEILREIAQKQGIPVVDAGLPEIDPSDLRGIPFLGDKGFPIPRGWHIVEHSRTRSAFARQCPEPFLFFNDLPVVTSGEGDPES